MRYIQTEANMSPRILETQDDWFNDEQWTKQVDGLLLQVVVEDASTIYIGSVCFVGVFFTIKRNIN